MSYTQEDIEELILSYQNDESLLPANLHTSSQPDTHAVYAYSIGKIISDGYVYKTGDSDNVDDRYKGVNAAILAEAEGTIELNTTIVHSTAIGGDAVAVYESGIATLNSTVVYTDKDRSAAILSSEGATATVNDSSILTKSTNSPAVLIINGSVEVFDSHLSTEQSPVIETTGSHTVALNNATIYGNPNSPEVLFIGGTEDTYNFFNAQDIILGGNGSSIFRSEDTVLGSKDVVNLTDVSIMVANPDGYIATANNGALQVNILDSQIEERNNLAHASGDSHLSIYTDSNIFGKITTSDNAELLLDIMDKTIFTGSANGSGIKVVLENSTWELTEDSYISEMEIDFSSLINKNGHSLFINGEDYTGGITIGSVVHYTTDNEKVYDREIIEKNCIVIKKIVLEDNSNDFILYDADDHLAYRAKKTEFKDTGKIVNVQPLLDQIEGLLTDIDKYYSNSTVRNKDENTNAMYIDAEEYNLELMQIEKYNNAADEVRGAKGQNAAIKVTNTTDNPETPGKLTLSDSNVVSDGYYATGISLDIGSEVVFDNVNMNVEGSMSADVDITDSTMSIKDSSLYSNQYTPLVIHDNSNVSLDTVQFGNECSEPLVRIQGGNNTVTDINSTYVDNQSNHIFNVVMEGDDTNNNITIEDSDFEMNSEDSQDIFKFTGDSKENEATLYLKKVNLNNIAQAGLPFYYIDPATVNIIAEEVEFYYYNAMTDEPHIYIDNDSVVNYKVINQPPTEPEPEPEPDPEEMDLSFRDEDAEDDVESIEDIPENVYDFGDEDFIIDQYIMEYGNEDITSNNFDYTDDLDFGDAEDPEPEVPEEDIDIDLGDEDDPDNPGGIVIPEIPDEEGEDPDGGDEDEPAPEPEEPDEDGDMGDADEDPTVVPYPWQDTRMLEGTHYVANSAEYNLELHYLINIYYFQLYL